jgi:hypothetical protein
MGVNRLSTGVWRVTVPGIQKRMRWEESVFALLDDLEQQAEGLALAERDAEVADLSVAEYARIGMGARLHASAGRELRIRLLGGHRVTGRLARVGADWLLLVDGDHEWIVRHAAMLTVAGASDRAHGEETWSVVDRLSLGALLRRLSAQNDRCLVHFVDDQQVEGRVGRVGRDFLELYVGEGAERTLHVVPVDTVAALQGRQG